MMNSGAAPAAVEEQKSEPTRASRERRWVLLVMGDQIVNTHALPESGRVTIGRAIQNDVSIDDPSISRRHAVLHIGSTIRIEDLGSANGTRVCDAKVFAPPAAELNKTAELLDRRVEPGRLIEVSPGNVIQLGSTTLVVQHGASTQRPRRLWPHGYFEGCLEKECARAERQRSSFAVVRVHVEPGAPDGAVEEALAVATRSVDVVANYGPNEFEVLIIDADPHKADDVKRRLLAELAERSAPARAGTACYPQDARSPEQLLSKACARVEGVEVQDVGAAVVVHDPAMQRLYRLVDRIADSTISVLLLGETGVGKEVLAETVHRLSSRKDRPFVRLNCAALSESLLESELFGHERGAFTGAVQAKVGLLEAGDGGTVFLDEIGEMPTSTQVKLLRVLEARQVLRVGSLKPRPIDVRFIAATNRDLEQEVANGVFREDLFFRLNGIPLVIPPLRERTAEIEPLARAFVVQACRKSGRFEPEISNEAMALLIRYSWPGNIRELRNVVERAILLCTDGSIRPEHLPIEKMGATLPARMPPRRSIVPVPTRSDRVPRSDRTPEDGLTIPVLPRIDARAFDLGGAGARDFNTMRPGAVAGDSEPPTPAPGLKGGVEQVERELILRALEQCAGNQTQAAKLLGISRRTLVSRLEQYLLPRPRKGRTAAGGFSA